MAIADDEMALQTARSDVGRSGAIRAGCVPRLSQLQSDGSLIWKRPTPNNGDPDDTVNTWTTGRD